MASAETADGTVVRMGRREYLVQEWDDPRYGGACLRVTGKVSCGWESVYYTREGALIQRGGAPGAEVVWNYTTACQEYLTSRQGA
jgi:hypothetical protein